MGNNGKKTKILLVDDDPAILRAVKKFLEFEGYEVVTAYDGKEGLDIIVQSELTPNKISLVITDLEMPVMSGLELMRAIRDRAIDIPIFIAPAAVPKEMIAGLVSKGVEILQKPFSPEELMEKINEVL